MSTRSNVFLYPQSWSEHITWLFWVRVLDFQSFVDPVRILSTENFSKWTNLSANHESSRAVRDIMHKEAILYSTIYLTFLLCSAIAFPCKVSRAAPVELFLELEIVFSYYLHSASWIIIKNKHFVRFRITVLRSWTMRGKFKI